MHFKPVDIAMISVFSAMWVVLNLTLGPIGFRLFQLPIFCDFSVFFTLLLATWASGKMGTASAVGAIGAIIVLAMNPSSTQMIGFLASAILFDVLMLLNRHKVSFKPYSLGVAAFATAISAYIAGVVIGTIFMRNTLEWALTFWGVWHLAGGIISIAIAIPVIGVLERANVKGVKMFDEKEALTLEIKNAENLHGHLGPFLVIGVKIARLAKKTLNLDYAKQKELQITAALPLSTPFSCIIDGIQAATQCTVGNQKLKIKNSKETITATFKLKNQGKALKIHVNPQVLEMLKDQFSKGVSNEELAWKIASMPEKQLLKIENLSL